MMRLSTSDNAVQKLWLDPEAVGGAGSKQPFMSQETLSMLGQQPNVIVLQEDTDMGFMFMLLNRAEKTYAMSVLIRPSSRGAPAVRFTRECFAYMFDEMGAKRLQGFASAENKEIHLIAKQANLGIGINKGTYNSYLYCTEEMYREATS